MDPAPMHDPDQNAAPVNPLPAVVVLLTGVLAAVEFYFQAGAAGLIGGPEAIGWRLEAAQKFAFSDRIFEWMLENRRFPTEHLIRFVAYPFVQPALSSAIFAIVLTLAIGKFVGEILSPLTVLAVFFGSAIAGAVGYGMILSPQNGLIGAFPAVYGLIGAYSWILFAGLRAGGQSGAHAFRLIGFLMAIQLAFKILFGGNDEWLAELIGFGTGFGVAVLLTPYGMNTLRNILAKLRER